MNLDERLASAAAELRSEVDQLDTPDFKPNRPKAPAMLALVLLLGVGIVGYVSGFRADESSGISVATQPEEPTSLQIDVDPVPEPSESAERESEPDPGSDPVAGAVPDTDVEPQAAPDVQGDPEPGQLTAALPGEFLMPLSVEGAWSADESKVILYRRGSPETGHVVVDTQTGEVLRELPFVPPDIEQLYWHPQDPDQVLYANGAALFSYSVEQDRSTEVHRFDGCDSLSSGVVPVPPSASGTVSLLCQSSSTTANVTFDLVTGAEQRFETVSDTAAAPSPSGSRLVRWNEDGSASVLADDLTDTGVVLDLRNNTFAFVTSSDGREWAAATLFDGIAVGTLVLVPLDGVGAPVVVIGPEQGDAYPPSGNQITAVGSRVFLTVEGPDDGSLAGRVIGIDVANPTAPAGRWSIPHNSSDVNGYWSTPFISPSPSGSYVAYSSDSGSGEVNTFIAQPGIAPG